MMETTKFQGCSKWSAVFIALLCLASLLASSRHALSAEFVEGIGGCDHMLVGEIVRGDMDLVIARDIRHGQTLCLNSPGGDVREGNAIASWLVGRNVRTVLPAMSACHSICAIIFMAGSDFEEVHMGRRAMHVTANLGFHAPYLQAQGSFSANEIEQAYADALGVMAEWMSLGSIIERGDTGFIPPRVMLELLSRGPDELYMVDTVYKARELNIELFGAPTPDWSVQNLCTACKNTFEGRVRTDMCSTAQEARRTDEFVDILFFGVGGEGSYHCGVRLEVDAAGAIVARVDPLPTWEGEPLNPVQVLTPEMALSAIGH